MTNDERKGIAKNIADKMKDVPNGELLRVWLERMTYIDNDDIAGWNEFYANCSNNKTLLYKGYNNEAIWEFSSQISNTGMPSILDDTIIALLSNAKQSIVQDGDVNQNILGPLTDDEIDIFYKYID